MLAATREADGLPVAIKVVHREDPTARVRLETEAQALSAIGPPYVPALYGRGVLDDGRPYLVIERLTMPTLDRVLGAPLAAATMAALLGPILDAVEAAHGCGFAHRDLSPQNIFVSRGLAAPGPEPVETPAVAKLIDFGLAKSLVVAPGTPVQTVPGMILGTPAYMSPEQCEGLGRVDSRADIYSLGIMGYEMIAGEPPFVGDASSVRMAHMYRRPPSLHGGLVRSEAVLDVLQRCLAKRPDRRFGSVAELRAALLPALDAASRSTRASAAAASTAEAAATAWSERPNSSPGASRRARTEDPAPISSSNQRRWAGVVLFEPEVDLGLVGREIGELGGLLAATSARFCAAVFYGTEAQPPVAAASAAAQALIERGVAVRVIVDRDQVRSMRSRRGVERVVGVNTGKAAVLLRGTLPAAVLLSRQAAEAVAPAAVVALPGRDDLVRVRAGSGEVVSMVGLGADGPLLGRDQVLAELVDSATECARERRPGLCTILAETGLGKSHLAATLSRTLSERDPKLCVLTLHARPRVGDQGARILGTLVASILREASEQVTPGVEVLLARLERVLGATSWPALALVCGWLSADEPALAKLRAAPSVLRRTAAQAAGELLCRLAARAPVCLVLDDGHMSDGITLDALEYATRAEVAAPLWVAVFAQPKLTQTRQHWGRRAASRREVTLGALADEDAAALCRRLLHPARDVPTQVVARLVAQTQGNPLLLTELARGIQRQGLIRRHDRGKAWFLAADELGELLDLPGIAWLVERELGALSPALAAHARLLSLLGASFTLAEVEGVLHELERDGLGDEFPLDAEVGCGLLREQGLLVDRGQRAFWFRHALFREQIVRLIPAPLTLSIHAAAGRYYEHASGLGEARRRPLLAYHAAQAGLRERAIGLYVELADTMRDHHDYVEAAELYSRALELIAASGVDPVRPRAAGIPAAVAQPCLRALRGRGLMHYRQSRFDDAVADLCAAAELAESLGVVHVRAAILLDQATALDWRRDFAASRACVDEARAIAPAGDSLLEARLALALGRAHHRAEDDATAVVHLEEAARRGGALGELGYEPRVIALLLLGYIYPSLHEIERAQAVFETCIALCEEHGDRLHLAAALSNRCELWNWQNQPERSARDMRRAESIGREIGQLSVEYVTARNLAELYYYTGDLVAVEAPLGRAGELEPITGDKPMMPLLSARLGVFAGDPERAREGLARVRAAEARARAEHNHSGQLGEAEEVIVQAVELAVEGAGEAAWHAVLVRAEAALGEVDSIDVMDMMAWTLHRRGEANAARQMWRQAHARSLAAGHVIEARLRRRVAAGDD